MFKRRVSGVVAVLVLFSFVTPIRAEEKISPRKERLIKELIEVTGVERQAEKTMDMVLAQMERNFSQMMSGFLKGEEREKFEKEGAETVTRFLKRYRELLPKRIDLGQLMEQVYFPLYDKYFTENELKDMIRFYESPTGKKFVKVTPQLTVDVMQKTNELLMPKIMQLVNEIMQEEKERLSKTEESAEKN
ncbi:MAG: DUF2059 domain-containing protein [Candidatus Omnitrophica bacterium]|nr:DUF2059 domain-containing protein [Candidatus Omnitrophota bacterium]